MEVGEQCQKKIDLNKSGESYMTNYLPNIKRWKFTDDEQRTIINLHSIIENKYMV